jgi:hypothetical protein
LGTPPIKNPAKRPGFLLVPTPRGLREPLRVRQNRRERFWTAEGRPRRGERQEASRNPRAPTSKTPLPDNLATRPGFLLVVCLRVSFEPLRVRQNRRERFWTAEGRPRRVPGAIGLKL